MNRCESKTEVAVEKAIAWLVTQQDENGCFKGKHKNTYTALSCMALMSAGYFPGCSVYGENIRKGIMFLTTAAQKENGYFGYDGGTMYAHGICCLALTEAYGIMPEQEDNTRIRNALSAGLKVIISSQRQNRDVHFGGWRYKPDGKDSDLSVTAWQILALRSAQNCMIDLPQKTIDDALLYIHSCYNEKIPGFCYMPGAGESPAMRTAGAVCLMALGANNSEDDKNKILKSTEFLKKGKVPESNHFYYMCYYLINASNMLGDECRKAMIPPIEEKLLSLQKETGEFEKYSGFDGGVYSTAFSIICLTVSNQYLPIFQE